MDMNKFYFFQSILPNSLIKLLSIMAINIDLLKLEF